MEAKAEVTRLQKQLRDAKETATAKANNASAETDIELRRAKAEQESMREQLRIAKEREEAAKLDAGAQVAAATEEAKAAAAAAEAQAKDAAIARAVGLPVLLCPTTSLHPPSYPQS